ncbi:hypothetical protein JHK87_022408 [Glycine soja]|nr:hypothetical protein JHK87_022408 [Glycine soja]
MEDVVPMDRLKDNGVLEEVPKERLSTMDKKPGTYDSEMISEAGLIDVGFKGLTFTWHIAPSDDNDNHDASGRWMKPL